MIKDYHMHPQIVQNPDAFSDFAKKAIEKGIGEQPKEYVYEGTKYLRYEIESDSIHSYKQMINLKLDEKAPVSWIEIDVI